jgi:hydroxymethylpyrimidine pyrophosphatase-like HAD family hydrolase
MSSTSTPFEMWFRAARPIRSFLLASDVDGTLVGDSEGEGWIKALVEGLGENLIFCVVTGRSRNSVLGLVAEERLPQPRYIFSSVGTELLDCSDPSNALGEKFAGQVPTNWNLETLYAAGEGPGVWRQDYPDGQPAFQAGFSWDGQAESLAAFRQRLTDLDQYFIQTSSGMYIDVLPHCLGKGQAALFLQRELHLPPEDVIVAGDDGNDKVMFQTGLKGIAPCNAADELKAVASESWHYHSPYPAGRGVIDGLKYFGLIDVARRPRIG